MNTKTNAEMLKSFKQRNKVSRETAAVKEGFANATVMISYLENLISLKRGHLPYESPSSKNTTSASGKKTTTKSSKSESSSSRVTIHVVDVLDASGSMEGSKYNAAVKGINMGISSLKEDKAEVDYSYTLCDFSNDIIFRSKTEALSNVDTFRGKTRGSTSLYDAIGKSIGVIKDVLKPSDKVLVNVYTDGQENSSRSYTADKIASLIEKLSKENWTFTFIGTDGDVKYAQSRLKFHDSNTLVHDNTGAGLEKAFTTNSLSRSAYSSKVEKGEDVSTGFYKDIN